MNDREREAIEDIMNEFDFRRARDVMEFLGWEWADTGIPSVEELREEARSLLEDTIEKDSEGIETGGLCVTHRGGDLELKFCIEEWDSRTTPGGGSK